MANQEQVALLKSGVDKWNAWRQAESKEIDLSGADLSGVSLKDANLSDANLSGANLTRANLSGANLTRAKLDKADLTNADLTGATGVNVMRSRGLALDKFSSTRPGNLSV